MTNSPAAQPNAVGLIRSYKKQEGGGSPERLYSVT